jgi:hypothetical protein
MASKSKQKSTITFGDAINRYYKLKGEYDTILKKGIGKIVSNNILSPAEKHDKYKTLKKKCIICGKTGGTIFRQDGNVLVAKCGNDETPCRLNIQLQKAKYINIMNDVNYLHNNVNTNKTSIVDTKLQFLFGFVNEPTTLSTFNTLKIKLVDSVKQYQKISEKYVSIIGNTTHQTKLLSLTDALHAEIQIFKDLIQNFEESSTIQFLKDAVELYVNKISVIAKEIQTLKYKVQYVYQENELYHLVQDSYTPSDVEIIAPGTENKILAFSI